MINLLAANWGDVSFILFAGIACIFAVAVLLTSNVVRMAFYLIISLGATAGLFFLAGAEFVGAMQLMIYVGGSQDAASQLEMADAKTATPLGLALTGVRGDKIDQGDEQLKEGMSGYLLPFVIVSIHLLVVLIGAAYMARAKRMVRIIREEEPEAPGTSEEEQAPGENQDQE